MDDEPMRHYLLSALEAELIACWRTLDEPTQATVSFVVASNTNHNRLNIDTPVILQLVKL